MYQPVEFRDDAHERAFAHVSRSPFGIVVAGCGSDMSATHIPLLLGDGERPQELLGHFAIRNSGLADLEDGTPVLAIFPGPHAYVSPSLYRVESPAPTWNYTAVHIYGSFRRVDQNALRSILERTVRRFEGTGPQAWTLETIPVEALRSLARGIAGFVIDIAHVEGGYKLSQNKLAEDVQSIERALRSSGGAAEREVADEMQRTGLRGRSAPSTTDPNVWLGPMSEPDGPDVSGDQIGAVAGQ